ncbi:hypothetical protein OHT52_05090 [Streptomyces sp. NBC_00247]|uniref:hypothetical protein n=1 Tax=Streptomyces sp. NBC_00247 TaxID=2975689 RepID=UPI002E28DB84|nr:hypothetical protein [Streptomyces sp. NBC_00247]
MLMLFFNEKSCTSSITQEQADEAMHDFIQVCRSTWKIYQGTTLVSEVPMENLEIAPGYYLQQWRNEPRNHDAWQFMRRTLQRKAPLAGVLPKPPDDQDSDYRHDGTPVLGLAAAHLMNSPAVSLPTGICWKVPWLKVAYETVDENGYLHGVADVRHIASGAHVVEHEEWIRDTAAAAVTTGAKLWAQRETLFPHLQLVPDVEQNLLDLTNASLPSVRQELLRLNTAAENWHPGQSEPSWAAKVVPESETRIKQGLCTFTDFDGSKKLFSLHCRFNPSPGRIHLRLITEEGKIRIGYVGRKRLTDGVPRSAR